jgi:hypothetical protein
LENNLAVPGTNPTIFFGVHSTDAE